MADPTAPTAPTTHHNTQSEKLSDTELEGQHEQPNLHSNVAAKVRNPLTGIPREKLMTQVETFCTENDMVEDIGIVQKGALVAQNPADFEELDVIDDEEKTFLRDEVLHKWRQTRSLYFTIVTCSIGAAVQGWDQTGSNGANLSFPQAYGIAHEKHTPEGKKDEWIVGVINAAPYIASAFIGCWTADPLNNWFGRRGAIFISGVFCFLPVIGSALCQTWPQLLICRLLLGIGMGLKGSSVAPYAAENAPASIRGALVMSWQMWTAFGIFLGFAANLAVYDTGDIAWRLQFGSAFIPAVPLLIGIYFCPESPRWYIKKRRYKDAYKSLLRLRRSKLQAARDLYYISAQINVERDLLIGESTYFSRAKELFTIPRVRRATIASFVVMIAQQMCGINIIAFYSSTIFVEAGSTHKEALIASFGFGLVNFLFAWPAFYTIDTFGRRTLLLFTFPNMAWSLLAAGLCYLIPKDNKAHLGLVAFFVYVFAAFYSPGEGPVPFTYSAEVFPLSHREVGMAWAVATCLFWAAVLSITFPSMLTAFGVVGTFGFYAGLNVIAFVMIFFLLPETKQRTLEELDYIFAVPNRTFARYQVTKALPWWIKRWVLFQKNAKLEPLYEMDQNLASDQGRRMTIPEGGIGRRFSSFSGARRSSKA